VRLCVQHPGLSIAGSVVRVSVITDRTSRVAMVSSPSHHVPAARSVAAPGRCTVDRTRVWDLAEAPPRRGRSGPWVSSPSSGGAPDDPPRS